LAGFEVTLYGRFWVTPEAAGGVFPARPQEEGADQRDEVVAAESLEEPDAGTPRGIEPVVPIEPAGLQGLPAEREVGYFFKTHLKECGL
jgi:hypothetical protein